MARIALSVLLIALSTALFTTVVNGQNSTPQPHVFWGDLFGVESVVRAVNETGAVVAERNEFWRQRWALHVFPEEASRVAFELESSHGSGRAEWFEVQAGGITEIRVYEFTGGAVLPSQFLEIEQPGAHQFRGSGLDGNFVRALRRPIAMGRDGENSLIQSVHVVNGSWSMVIERAGELVRTAMFETRIGPRLYRTKLMPVHGGGVTVITRADFRPVTEAAAFWGRDFGHRRITLLTDERGAFDTVPAVAGEWSLVHNEAVDGPVPGQFVMLQFGHGNARRWTGPLSFIPGVVTQVALADFNRTEWPGAPPQRNGDTMESGGLSRPSEVNVVIIARLRPNQRIEFGIRLPESGLEIFTARRFLPANPPLGRWLRSTPIGVEVDGASVVVGSIIARRVAGGRTEFGFRPDWTQISDQFPPERFFPAAAAVDRWLRSGVISVPISP